MNYAKPAALVIGTDIAGANASLLRQVCERLLRAREDIRGIILFGSLARKEPHQDVDLLVVLGREKMERSEQDRALIALREVLGLDATIQWKLMSR